MKRILEIACAIALHPVAVVLSWINILGRTDLSFVQKILWGGISVFPVGPILYVLFGGGELW